MQLLEDMWKLVAFDNAANACFHSKKGIIKAPTPPIALAAIVADAPESELVVLLLSRGLP